MGLGAILVAEAGVWLGARATILAAAAGVLEAGSAVSVGGGGETVAGAVVSVTRCSVGGLAVGAGVGTQAMSVTATRNGNSLRRFINPPVG